MQFSACVMQSSKTVSRSSAFADASKFAFHESSSEGGTFQSYDPPMARSGRSSTRLMTGFSSPSAIIVDQYGSKAPPTAPPAYVPARISASAARSSVNDDNVSSI